MGSYRFKSDNIKQKGKSNCQLSIINYQLHVVPPGIEPGSSV